MKQNNFILFLLFALFSVSQLSAQSLKIMPDGVVIPKADHTVIVLEENGQMVYDTVTKSVWYFNNSVWKEVGSDNLGNHNATTTLNMDDNPIENVSTPVNDMDAVNKAYVDLDLDKDTLNEIQTISASVDGDTLYLSASNWLIVPGLSDANYIKDFDGNVYNEVVIGSQTWLIEHLRTTHYNDGTPIPKMEDALDWDDWENSWDGSMYTDTYDAYTWYSNDSTTYNEFGVLYNWGVVDSVINGGKNACPVGYIIPTSSDIQTLVAASGGNIAGINLKFPPPVYWINDQTFPFGGKGTNASGFSALGTGYRNAINANFEKHKDHNHIWTRTGGLTDNVSYLEIRHDDWQTYLRTNGSGGEGHTIRCIKDE